MSSSLVTKISSSLVTKILPVKMNNWEILVQIKHQPLHIIMFSLTELWSRRTIYWLIIHVFLSSIINLYINITLNFEKHKLNIYTIILLKRILKMKERNNIKKKIRTQLLKISLLKANSKPQTVSMSSVSKNHIYYYIKKVDV